MISFIRSKKYIVNIILALVAIGIEYYYSTCETSCSYLRGEFFSIGLQYVGVAFMVVVIILNIIKKDMLLLMLLSAGVGVEIYLVGFQIYYNTYCLYCLLFAGVLVIQFLVSLDWKKKYTVFLSMAAALLIFPIFFRGAVTPVYGANESMPPTFGKGPVKVRLYTDYFCKPCRSMEPKVESTLTELVGKNLVTLTFVDMPFYQYSSMYARYFLYSTREKNDLDSALVARNILIGAASENIRDMTEVEERLRNKEIPCNPFDVKPIFTLFEIQLRNDKIRSTPSCVVEQNGKKELFVGAGDIVDALEKLLKKQMPNLPVTR